MLIAIARVCGPFIPSLVSTKLIEKTGRHDSVLVDRAWLFPVGIDIDLSHNRPPLFGRVFGFLACPPILGQRELEFSGVMTCPNKFGHLELEFSIYHPCGERGEFR